MNTVPYFTTPVEDPSIPKDKVVCRDCGQQIPATFAEMSEHKASEDNRLSEISQTVKKNVFLQGH